MVVTGKPERNSLLDRYFVIAGAFALLWLLERVISPAALIGIVVLGCICAFGCSQLARLRDERQELLAWVECNAFPEQSIAEWLAEPNQPDQSHPRIR